MKIRFTVLALALVLLCVQFGCGSGKPDGLGEIAVIVKATDSDFWQNVRSGVVAAATEYNAQITFDGPDSEEDYMTQNAMITAAVARGAAAIVISAIDYERSADAVNAAAAAGVRVITIDSGVNTDRAASFIGTDNTTAGRLAGKAALDAVKARGDDKAVVGIVNCDPCSENIREREQAFRDYIAENGGRIAASVSVTSDAESSYAGAAELLKSNPGLNVIVGLNEWTTLGVGYAVRDAGVSDKVAAIGFDQNLISVAMLESGEMDALLVQNSFAMGYLGVQSAVELLSGKAVEPLIRTSTVVITKENMFDTYNQRILFRLQ